MGRASRRKQAWALKHRRVATVGWGWGELQEAASMSGAQMHRPRVHSTSHTLPVVVMATVAMIIENFQKTRMLDIIYRVF